MKPRCIIVAAVLASALLVISRLAPSVAPVELDQITAAPTARVSENSSGTSTVNGSEVAKAKALRDVLPDVMPAYEAFLCGQWSVWNAAPPIAVTPVPSSLGVDEPNSTLNTTNAPLPEPEAEVPAICSDLRRRSNLSEGIQQRPRNSTWPNGTTDRELHRNSTKRMPHQAYTATHLCLDEDKGAMQYGLAHSVRYCDIHDDWSRARVHIQALSRPPIDEYYAPKDVRAMLMPSTYDTVGNIAHVLYRLAATRLRVTRELGVDPGISSTELRTLTANRYHFVVYVTGARFSAKGHPPPHWQDRDAVRRHIGYNKFSETLGGNWSVVYDRDAEYAPLTRRIPLKRGEKKRKRKFDMVTYLTWTPRRVCFHEAFIGYEMLRMYLPKEPEQWEALAATASGVVEVLAPLAEVPTWRTSQCDGAPCRSFCLIQREHRARVFVDLPSVLRSLRSLLAGQEDSAADTTPRARWNVTVVSFERMTLKEQVRRVRSCTVLMGLHGAALTNAAFTDVGTLVIDMQAPKQAGAVVTTGLNTHSNYNTAYGALARVAGAHFLGVALRENHIIRLPKDKEKYEFNLRSLPPRFDKLLTTAIRKLERLGAWNEVLSGNVTTAQQFLPRREHSVNSSSPPPADLADE
jgi:hypothetical protein